MDQRLANKRALLIGGLAVLVVGYVITSTYLAVRHAIGRGENSPDHPGGIPYVCGKCGKGFVLTTRQLAAHHKAHWGQPVPCPACGAAEPQQGIRCAECGRIFPHDRLKEEQICPHCRTPAGRPGAKD